MEIVRLILGIVEHAMFLLLLCSIIYCESNQIERDFKVMH